jgi:predicted DNA-binding transcriptional regulator AlpA
MSPDKKITSNPGNGNPGMLSENLRPRDAAQYLGVSESLLAKLRMRDRREIGPTFIKISGCILYRRSDLDAWLDQNAVEVKS